MTIKIKNNDLFDKKFLENLSKNAELKIKDDIYEYNNIKNEDSFLYNIAKQINKIAIKKYLKKQLKKKFSEEKTNQIINAHKKETTENEFFEFLLKIYLKIFFLNDNILNLNAFFKFNVNTYLKELKQIANLEIESDGNFLENSNDEFNNFEDTEFYKIENFIKDFKDKNIESFENCKVYFDKKIKIINDDNQEIQDMYFNEIKNFYETLNSEKPLFEVFNFIILLCIINPKKVILYNSLNNNKDLYDEIIKFFGKLFISKNITSTLFKTNEFFPNSNN